MAWLVKMGMTCRLQGSSIQYKRMLPSGNGIIYRNVDGCHIWVISGLVEVVARRDDI